LEDQSWLAYPDAHYSPGSTVYLKTIIIASDWRSEVTICEIHSVRSCVTACCEAAR